MVLNKNYERLEDWSAPPTHLIWDIEADHDASNNSSEREGKENNKDNPQTGADVSKDKKQDNSPESVTRMYDDQASEDNATRDIPEDREPLKNCDAGPSKANEAPRGWLQKSLSVIGKVIRNADQTQTLHLAEVSGNSVVDIPQEGFKEALEARQEADGADCHTNANKSNDTVHETGSVFGHIVTPQETKEEEAENHQKEAEDAKNETPHARLKHKSMNSTVVEASTLHEESQAKANDGPQEEEDSKAKVKNLEFFVQDSEKMEQDENTKASQALQDSTMKDPKVTQVVAAAVIIGAGFLHVSGHGMSPDIPFSDIMAVA